MFDMFKTIVLDILGLKSAPVATSAVVAPFDEVAVSSKLFAEPTGYPVFDSTGIVSVTEDQFGIL